MWETLRHWEHSRVDWAFDHPLICLTPFILYGGMMTWFWWVDNTHSGFVFQRWLSRKKKKI
jgi:hypothetical protein